MRRFLHRGRLCGRSPVGFLAGILVGCLIPALLATTAPAGEATARAALENGIEKGKLIRVQSGTAAIHLDTPRIRGDELVDGYDGGELTVPLAAVVRVEYRDNHAAQDRSDQSAQGGLTFSLALAGLESDIDGGATVEDYVTVTMVGALGGAVLGAGVGILVPRWKPVYRRDAVPVNLGWAPPTPNRPGSIVLAASW